MEKIKLSERAKLQALLLGVSEEDVIRAVRQRRRALFYSVIAGAQIIADESAGGVRFRLGCELQVKDGRECLLVVAVRPW